MSVADPSRAAPPARPRGWLFGSEKGRSLLEGLGALVLLAEGVALLLLARRLGPLLLAALAVQWLLLLVGLRWLGLFRALGPVFFYDLVRATRRGRYFLLRSLYVLGLLLLLWSVWSSLLPWNAGPPSLAQLAAFGAVFFFWFITVQFGVVALLTPAYTAGAIAEEKERRTLEFVLATDLRDREIVLGKLASRLLNLSFLVLAGVPVLALLQFVGGIDPGLLLAGFAATAITMISLASVSILFSAQERRASGAIALTYLTVLMYLLLAGFSWLLLVPPGWADFPNSVGVPSPVTLATLVAWLNAGSPIYGMMRVAQAMGNSTLTPTLLEVLGGYALFHGLVTL
ncbi:MAG TPA: ABC transporter permease subunit, partial [Gemmataceae bacterium]|nr:ABC transporter permease subunit [Gemmataceae bacterium]